jgi:PPP family 3-phenylpropionic acid transporter
MSDAHALAAGGRFELRLSVFYFASFLIAGCYLPYLPLWLQSKGLTELQISIVYAAPIFIRAAFTPLLTFLADRSGRPLRVLVLITWGAMASVALLPITDGFYSIFVVILLFTLFWMAVMPLTDAAALAGARRQGADYGRMRLWGSISFIFMTAVGGAAVDFWGPQAALWLFISASVAAVIASRWLPRDEQIAGGGVEGAAGIIPPPVRFADVTTLIRQPELWFFFAAAGALQSSHAVYYIFGSLHWSASGISPVSIGALWAIGVVAEVILFAYGGRVVRWAGPVQLILIAGAAAVLRWTATAFDPPLVMLFIIQALHGLTFGATHLGAMHFLQRAVPSTLSASAQGLYASLTAGIAMGTVSLATGPLYRHFGGEAFLAMAALGGAGLLAGFVLLKRWDGGLIVRPA